MGLNGAQKAKLNIKAFESWAASLTDVDFRAIEFRGKLNRVEVAKGCNFAKSVLLQNDTVKTRLLLLENSLRERGVLPPLADKSAEKTDVSPSRTEHDQNNSKRLIDSRRLRQLESENLTLKVEVARLKKELSKFTELSDVLYSSGVLPR